MKKIAILNDTHTGIRNSSDVFLNNAEKFYTDVFFPYLMENGIRHIVHLGDYFDNRKHINFRALNRNRGHFLSVLREHGITMDIICGNHDTFYKDTNDLNSLKELLGHYMNEVNIIHKPMPTVIGLAVTLTSLGLRCSRVLNVIMALTVKPLVDLRRFYLDTFIPSLSRATLPTLDHN